MQKKAFFFVLVAAALMMGPTLQAQKYFTREGKVSFFSDAPVEKIEAHNSKATAVLDATTGEMEFAVLIKAFQFEKALMQEHFNENYMESSKYPKAFFKGEVPDMGEVNLGKDGEYPVKVKGNLTIHGVTREVEAPGKFIVKDRAISAVSSFTVLVADYDIEIPAVVRDNIAREVRIEVEVGLEELKKGS
ncbi:MAG: YceI family protein [Lewinellaceae bacterium]|nr:YceI family protein [Lewinellaceae bacterium]MCB9288470.1 YceI family protein [Lewinellaceae bacterium]